MVKAAFGNQEQVVYHVPDASILGNQEESRHRLTGPQSIRGVTWHRGQVMCQKDSTFGSSPL